jgi:hypothetical protein
MISGALSTARAIAAKEQRYAGVRFQTAYHPDGPLNAPQYMIFIVQDPTMVGTRGYGFRAVEGLKPIKLPENVVVTDFTVVVSRNENNPVNPSDEKRLDNPAISNSEKNDLINNYHLQYLMDTITFSIIFSPSGKLVIHGVRIRNRDSLATNGSSDDIFNTLGNVPNGIGMFVQDDYFDYGLGPEPSRSSFVIYDRERFGQTNPNKRWTDYLSKLEMIYINPYTGRMIARD